MALQARTVRLSSRLWEAVDKLAHSDGVSSSEIVREAVIRMLERAEVERVARRKRGMR